MKPIQPPLWVEDFLSNDVYYFGFIIILSIIFIGVYAYHKHTSYIGGWSEFSKSKGFGSTMFITSVIALFLAMEMYFRISMYFQRSRYKVLVREMHQMIATDASRNTDVDKLESYKKLVLDRSKQRRFVDPIMYQKSDELDTLDIMKLNEPYK